MHVPQLTTALLGHPLTEWTAKQLHNASLTLTFTQDIGCEVLYLSPGLTFVCVHADLQLSPVQAALESEAASSSSSDSSSSSSSDSSSSSSSDSFASAEEGPDRWGHADLHWSRKIRVGLSV